MDGNDDRALKHANEDKEVHVDEDRDGEAHNRHDRPGIHFLQ